ncbi:hypothetical protein [Aurantibacter aestuarii]|uniref:Tetratricopeptide repeat protein n=1 Tax=Aurantibacter aestuarii TaxID=1266046 RepID=A0A2T1N5B9_9FLAO|nr:hypothetical protein [Aurantibacter aestuarii]PSG86439.1 hypothetical protein C7H52_12180 [Aurantibacter aestuarii]
MTKLFLIIATLMAPFVVAQNNYDVLMQNALQEKDFDALCNKFKEVNKQFPDQWLPNYYLAYHNINNSFLNLKDEDHFKEKLENAQYYIDRAHDLKPDKAELLVLQAKLYLAYVVSNTEKYGRSYAPIITKLNNDAFLLAPNNPRVVLNKAQWEIGMAKYFGSSTKSLCKDLELALNKFQDFKSKGNYAPSWGLDEIKKELSSCKEMSK